MLIELSEAELRCLVSALNLYIDFWSGMRDRVDRRRKMIDRVTCQGVLDAQSMDVDIEIAKSRIFVAEDLKLRLAQTIR